VTLPGTSSIDEPAPTGNYAIARLTHDLVFVAGMTPKENGTLLAIGRVGGEISPHDGRHLAAIATRRAIAAATQTARRAGKSIRGVASLTVYVAAVQCAQLRDRGV
jgi:enamine deaminase RidA (YjgF/YER057c/UK114 family)